MSRNALFGNCLTIFGYHNNRVTKITNVNSLSVASPLGIQRGRPVARTFLAGCGGRGGGGGLPIGWNVDAFLFM